MWRNWRSWSLLALSLAQATCFILASEKSNEVQLAAVLIAACLGAITLLWIVSEREFEQLPLAFVFLAALLLRLIAAQASPLLEDDHYRYLWDGMRMVSGFDPYRHAPAFYFSATELTESWHAILSGINNPHLPTIYGPALQWLFALAYVIAPGKIGALQALLIGIDLACLLTLLKAGVNTRWLLVYALHPLILKEGIASAHPDGLLGLFLLLAFIALRHRYSVFAGLLLGAAVATKISAVVVLVLLPWFSAPMRRIALGFVLSLMLLYGPFLLNSGSDFFSLSVFAQSWRFNPLIFRFVELISNASLARPIGGLCVICLVFVMAWNANRTRQSPWQYWDLAVLALLSFSPVVNPWYWLWVLPLAILSKRITVPTMALVTSLAYLNSAVLSNAPDFYVGWPITLVQVVVLVGCFAYDISKTKVDSAHLFEANLITRRFEDER